VRGSIVLGGDGGVAEGGVWHDAWRQSARAGARRGS
jgi:hypothetical protein